MTNILISEDISCLGQVSMTASLPVLAGFGFNPVVLPTAILSSHTGYLGNTFLDMSTQLPEMLAQWRYLQLNFDAVYLGYLGHSALDFWLTNIAEFSKSLILLDPAMADHGKLYRGLDAVYVEKMRQLAEHADILTPNLTEARLLLDLSCEQADSIEEAKELASKLAEVFKLKQVVITGIELDELIAVVGWDRGNAWQLMRPKTGRSFFGTGDLFASCLLGALLKGMDLHAACALAADFIIEAIAKTGRQDHRLGPNANLALPWLIKRVNNERERL